MSFNNQRFYEETLLHMLFVYGKMSTQSLEKFFNFAHEQLINNVISNRGNSTSLILKEYMRYDENTQEISITPDGKGYIQEKYQK